jgi:calcineurin-like phosphoesterase family protein
MSKVFFSSDQHWGHGNIVKYCKRLQFCSEAEKEAILKLDAITDKQEKHQAQRELRISPETVDRMNEAMINNWNALVSPQDTVYLLGDLCFPKQDWQKWLDRLHGNIFWLRGNHDAKISGRNYPSFMEINIEGQEITLCHYSMRVWKNSCHGAWCLFGHSHNTLPPYGLSMDVGVDCNDFKPFSFEEIKTIMTERLRTLSRCDLGMVGD